MNLTINIYGENMEEVIEEVVEVDPEPENEDWCPSCGRSGPKAEE